MITFLIGAVIGGFVVGAFILGGFKVLSKEAWMEEMVRQKALYSSLEALTAENAKLQVALSAGMMTDDGKKVAAMTMEALGGVIASKQPVR